MCQFKTFNYKLLDINDDDDDEDDTSAIDDDIAIFVAVIAAVKKTCTLFTIINTPKIYTIEFHS